MGQTPTIGRHKWNASPLKSYKATTARVISIAPWCWATIWLTKSASNLPYASGVWFPQKPEMAWVNQNFDSSCCGCGITLKQQMYISIWVQNFSTFKSSVQFLTKRPSQVYADMYYKICGHKIQHVMNYNYILDNFWFLPETGVRFPEFLSYEDLAFRKTGKNFPTKFFLNE